LLVLGLDEAGYGPLLGPLVVGASAFRVRERGADLRSRLKGLVCRAGKGKKRGRLPVPIDDSKEVRRCHGTPGLARGVRAMLAAADKQQPTHLADWLTRFGDRPPDAFAADPWFLGPEDEAVPRADVPRDFRARCLLRGVEPLGVWVSPVRPAELNAAFDSTDNKGRVLFLTTLTLVVRLLEAHPGEDCDVTLDREGGRLDYGAWLADVFPFHEIVEEPAPRGSARYRMAQGGREVRFAFVTRGDVEHLEVGLASMAAKLTRELFLGRFNAWFGARQAGLKPTAGYVEDGRRWLADAAPVLERERVDLRCLVRER
jgi:hypothetical protein